MHLTAQRVLAPGGLEILDVLVYQNGAEAIVYAEHLDPPGTAVEPKHLQEVRHYDVRSFLKLICPDRLSLRDLVAEPMERLARDLASVPPRSWESEPFQVSFGAVPTLRNSSEADLLIRVMQRSIAAKG